MEFPYSIPPDEMIRTQLRQRIIAMMRHRFYDYRNMPYQLDAVTNTFRMANMDDDRRRHAAGLGWK